MSYLRGRAGPLAAVALLGGVIYYQAVGGQAEPYSRAQSDAPTRLPVSETLQELTGSGGSRSGTRDDRAATHDPKDTRIYSHSPTAGTKRNPDKTTAHLPHAGMQGPLGKNIGAEADLDWKAKGGRGGARESQARDTQAEQGTRAAEQAGK